MVTIPVEIDVPMGRIADLVINAFEGGYSPWIGVATYKGHERPVSGYVWWGQEGLYEHPGFKFELAYDGGNDDEGSFASTIVIDRQKLIEGVARFSKEAPIHFADWRQENDDAITADVFMQTLVLGEIIYG